MLRGARVAHYGSLLIAFAVLLFITRHQWFFYDEWDFLASRGLYGRALDLFAPHNEHWSTIPILVYRGLFAGFGLHSYLPYLAVLLAVHVAVAHLMWRLLIRNGTNAWLATAVVVFFLFLGGAWQDLTWAFQMTFLGAVGFGLIAILILDRDQPVGWPLMLGVWLALVAALMCSGIGVTMVVLAGATMLFRHGLRSAATVVSCPAIVYVIWVLAVGHEGLNTTAPITAEGTAHLPEYVWTGLTSSVDAMTGLTGAGSAILVALVLWLIWHRHDLGTNALMFAGAITVVVFFLVNGVARVGLGVTEAQASRYVYIAAVLLLPALVSAINALGSRDRLAQLCVILVLVYPVLSGASTLWTQARAQAAVKNQDRGQILAAAGLLESGIHAIGLPDPAVAPQLTAAQVLALARHGDLPASDPVSDQNRFSALAALSTSVTTSPRFTVGGTTIVDTAGALVTERPGCVRQRATSNPSGTIHLAFAGPASVRLESASGGTLLLSLQPGGEATPTSNAISVPVPAANRPAYLNEEMSGAAGYVQSPLTDLELCTTLPP